MKLLKKPRVSGRVLYEDYGVHMEKHIEKARFRSLWGCIQIPQVSTGFR